MRSASEFWPLLTITVAMTHFAIFAAAQSPPPLAISSSPVGLRPLGIAIGSVPISSTLGTRAADFGLITNPGDNSVSGFSLGGSVPMPMVTGIPSPYGIAACSPVFPPGPSYSTALVTSPSDNSVWVLRFVFSGGAPSSINAGLAGRVPTGAQPYSVACSRFLGGESGGGVVSNFGDSTLTIFDVASRQLRATIPGVPGSRGLHGIAVSGGPGTLLAWVAGTDANVVTAVDLTSRRVLTQIPVSRPTAVRTSVGSGSSISAVFVASAGGDSIIGYHGTTFRAVEFQSVPNPQDFVFSPVLGGFAISGPDSLWRFDLKSLPGTGGPVATIPGAALAAYASDYVFVTSTTTNQIYQIRRAPGPSTHFSVSNGASFATGQLAPGSLGSALVSTGVSESLNASFFSMPLPKTLGGVTLKIGGSLNFNSTTNNWEYSPTGAMDAPLHFVGPNQINFQVPTGIALGDSIPAQLTTPDGSRLFTMLNIKAAAPGIFSLLQNGQGQGAVLNDDFSQNGIPQIIVGAKPAARGSVIQIFATGAGATNPPLLAGEPAPASGNPLVLTQVQPTVAIGGKTAPVLFSGLAPGFVGLWQVNAEVPQDVAPGQAVPLSITAGGVASNTVTIAVQ